MVRVIKLLSRRFSSTPSLPSSFLPMPSPLTNFHHSEHVTTNDAKRGLFLYGDGVCKDFHCFKDTLLEKTPSNLGNVRKLLSRSL
nr:hypothetical protein 4 - rat [Rattus norvegicus]